MELELFTPQSFSVSSSRILYTPSTFAITSMLHLQEACSLQVALIKSNWQNESCMVEEALLYYGQSFFSTNISTKAGKNLLIGYDIDNITYLVSAISHATRTCSVLMFSQEYSRKKREKLQLYAAF